MSGTEDSRGEWHAYRCPVCGHTDEVVLEERRPCRLACTHCAAPLEVEARGADVARVTVRVVSGGDGDPC